jgi:HAE1 family hydrophobic/amphiphilic exporter-1
MVAAAYYPALWLAKLVKLLGRGVAFGLGLVLHFPSRAFDALFGYVSRTYPTLLDAVLRRPASTVAMTLVLLGASLLLLGQLGRELVPELIQGEFYVNTELPPGTHLDVTSRQLAAVEKAAQSLDGVQVVYAMAGTSNEQGGRTGEMRENIAQLTLTVAPPASREKEEALMERLRPALERSGDLEYRFGRPSYFSFKTPVEVEIRGYNLRLLERLADDLVERMRGIRGLVDVKSSTEGGNPELQIRFKRDRLAALGRSVSDVATLIRSKVLGNVATDITREDRTIDIRLWVDERYR